MRLSVYMFGYRIFVVDVETTSNATYQPEKVEVDKLFDRMIKSGSRYCMNAMMR